MELKEPRQKIKDAPTIKKESLAEALRLALTYLPVGEQTPGCR